jgi:SNF2 family DNA or RNA helicase
MNLFPALVVCPNTLKLNWRREVRKWIPQRRVEVINATDKQIWLNTDITVINYDLLQKHSAALAARGYVVMVLDESHMVKERGTIRAKECIALSKIIPKKLLLTGTPIVNRPKELISQLMILERMKKFGTQFAFLQHYCQAQQTKYGWDTSGASNLEELHEKLRATCMVRRRKEDVLKELPDKQYTFVPMELDNPAEYALAERDVVEYLKQCALKNKAFLAAIAHMTPEDKQNAMNARASSAEAMAERNEALRRIEICKQLAAKGKMAGLIEWITDVIDTGQKLVVFGHHVAFVKKLVNHFKDSAGAVCIMGEVSLEDRDKNVQRFQNDDNCRLIVCNMEAGGLGLTLTAASTAAFFELGWTPTGHDQCEGRLHRISQKNAVAIYYLLAAGTIDEEIYSILRDKRDVVDAVTDGVATPAAESTIYRQLVARLTDRKEGADDNPADA